jgi:hypothetical protein
LPGKTLPDEPTAAPVDLSEGGIETVWNITRRKLAVNLAGKSIDVLRTPVLY